MSTDAARQSLKAIQAKWGTAALRSAADLSAARPAPFPTGIACLDGLTGLGGLPLGRLTGISGKPGAGSASLAQAIAAAASRVMVTVYLDLGRGLDPAGLLSAGADADRVYVAQPENQASAVELARALLRAGLPALVVHLGRGPTQPREPLAQAAADLAALAARAGSLLLLALSTDYPGGSPVAYASSLWLGLERLGWLEWHGDLAGIRTRVTALRSKVGASGQSAALDLRYPLPGVPAFLEDRLEGLSLSGAPPQAPVRLVTVAS